MISIGDRLGIKEDIYALVTFDETGSQGDPMGRYHDQPVFPDRMDRAKVEQGGSYACMLYVPDGMNIYRAKVIEPVTMESISDESPEFKEDLARIAVERYPEALGEYGIRGDHKGDLQDCRT